MNNEYLSIKKRIFCIWIATLILIGAAFFAAGYIYHGQEEQSPIIIEKKS